MGLNNNFSNQASWLSVGSQQTENWMYYYSYDYSGNNNWGSFIATDYDYYSVYLDKGNYSVATSASSNWYTNEGYSTLDDNSIEVYNSNGTVVATADSAGFSTATVNATESGYYYIRVKNDGSSLYTNGYYDILVSSTNSAPTLTSDAATLKSVVIASGKSSGTMTILASDLLKGYTDAEGDTISVVNLSTTSGTLTKSNDGKSWTLSASTEGTAALNYYVSDGKTSTAASNYVSVIKSADAAIIQSVVKNLSSEDGGEAQIKVNLAAAPSGSQSNFDYNVSLTYQVMDTTEGKFVLSDGSLSDKITVKLTQSNWSDGVTIKVRGIQDYDNDGDKTYTVKQISASTNSQNYTEKVRDIKSGGETFSLINTGEKDSMGRDRDKPIYLVGDDGKPTEDTLVGLDGADRLYGGYMIDDLDGGLGNDRLYGGYEDDFLYGKGGDDQLYGETDDDYLYGGDGKDRLDGGSGSDTMEGGAGNDVYYVSLDDDGAVEDTITEAVNSGSDTVYVPYEVETYVLPDNVEILKMNAGFGNSSVTGNTANNTIVANAGDNEVDGGAGSDLITGGKGADELTGGSGNDSFVYNSTKDSNSSDTDIIWDFSLGDKVDLSGIDSKASVVGNQAFTFITSLKSGTFAANTEGTVGFYKDYLYVNTDSDSDAELVIKVIGLDITSTNLLVL